MTAPRQSAELRVVYKQGDCHALVATVTVRGFDVYSSLPGGAESMIGASYHETGKTHTKIAGDRKRLIGTRAAPVQDFRGVERVWETAPLPDSLDWSYRLKAEKGTRRNLTIDLDALNSPAPPTVAVWMIERGGVAELADVMQQYRNSQWYKFVDCKLIDWTQPWLLAVVRKPTTALVESLREQIPRLGLPEGGWIGGFVSGPAPTGKMVKLWPEPEETTELPIPKKWKRER